MVYRVVVNRQKKPSRPWWYKFLSKHVWCHIWAISAQYFRALSSTCGSCWKIVDSLAALTREIFFKDSKKNFVSPGAYVISLIKWIRDIRSDGRKRYENASKQKSCSFTCNRLRGNDDSRSISFSFSLFHKDLKFIFGRYVDHSIEDEKDRYGNVLLSSFSIWDGDLREKPKGSKNKFDQSTDADSELSKA